MRSVIPRASVQSIENELKSIPEDEIQAAYAQIGESPNRNTKSWYRDIYEFYQNNEC